MRECVENFDSSASPQSDRYDDYACCVEIWSRIRNGTSDEYIDTCVQRVEFLRRLTTDDIHMSAGFHLPDMREDRFAEVESGVNIGLIVHLADEQKSVRILDASGRELKRQVHTVWEYSHIVIPKNPAVIFRADEDLGASLT